MVSVCALSITETAFQCMRNFHNMAVCYQKSKTIRRHTNQFCKFSQRNLTFFLIVYVTTTLFLDSVAQTRVGVLDCFVYLTLPSHANLLNAPLLLCQ